MLVSPDEAAEAAAEEQEEQQPRGGRRRGRCQRGAVTLGHVRGDETEKRILGSGGRRDGVQHAWRAWTGECDSVSVLMLHQSSQHVDYFDTFDNKVSEKPSRLFI